MLDNKISIEFQSLSQNEGFARVAVSAFIAQLDPTIDEMADVKTAVSEAVTNSIIHGYENDKKGIIKIESTIYGKEVTITVNKIAVVNNVTVKVNIKEITGYKETVEGGNTTNTTDSTAKNKEANISISIGNSEVFSTKDKLDNEDFSTKIPYSGKAQVTIVITDANNGKWTRTQYVDFSKDTIIEFKK